MWQQWMRLPEAMRNAVFTAIEAREHDPRPPGCEKQGETATYQVRVALYRVLYAIADEVLLVLLVKVGHRRDVYHRR